MCFYGEGLLVPRPTLKLEDHPSSAVRGCLFNLFIATLHIGGRSSIRNLRTRHAVVTGTHIHGGVFLENVSRSRKRSSGSWRRSWGLDGVGSGQGQVAGICGYGEGLSGSINAGNFLTSCKASQEGLCSME